MHRTLAFKLTSFTVALLSLLLVGCLSEPTPTPVADQAPSWATIVKTYSESTTATRDEYSSRLIGKKVVGWQGRVYDVENGNNGDYHLIIELDEQHVPDLGILIGGELGTSLRKNEEVEIWNGVIISVKVVGDRPILTVRGSVIRH